MKEDNERLMNFILIDGSYYIFYRYYALLVWWKHVHKENEISKENTEKTPYYKNAEFLEKFKKTFSSKIMELENKLKLKDALKKDTIKIVARDCPRDLIWRKKYYSIYKDNRDSDFMGKDFFKMVYDEKLFEKTGIKTVLKYPELEADDCIAITTKYILSKYSDAKIWIIASDMDYLQLASEKVTIINLKYKDISKSAGATNKGPECDKFCKIICGDVSDNIGGVFEKCGKKTAIKLYENKSLFYEKLNKSQIYKDKYELNKKLIDFDEIPEYLVEGFTNNLTLLKI